MSVPSDVVKGDLVVTNLPDLACFSTFAEFLAALPDFVSVEIPNSVTNVVVSNVQPTDSQTSYLWIRLTNSGAFLGLFVFSNGLWRQIYPVPNQLFRVYGLSNDIPDGFQLATDSTALSSAQKTFLQGTWHLSPDTVNYDIFDIVYVGF